MIDLLPLLIPTYGVAFAVGVVLGIYVSGRG